MPSYHTHRFLIMFIPIIFFTVLLSCSDPDDDAISVNEQTSKCGGFKTLAKRCVGFLLQEDTIPCLEETLFWRYNPTSKVLTLMHRHIIANCASELSMSVIRDENRYVIRHIDISNISANCICNFDLYCEIPGVSDSVITLTYDTISAPIELKHQSGKIITYPLEYLDIIESNISDLSSLTSYPQLKSLGHIDAKKFTDLSPIGSLPNLISLSCFNVDSIAFLAPCIKLEYLELHGTPHLKDISALGNLHNLKLLYIYNATSVQDISPIGNCGKLERLSLKSCSSVTDISSISNCTDLTDLVISGARSLTTLESLSKLTKLTNLSLDSIPEVQSLEPLQTLSSLTTLTITNNDIITDLSFLSRLNSLHQLNLVNITAVTNFTPLLSSLDKGDLFTYIGVPIPAELLDQLKQKGVIYKGRDRMQSARESKESVKVTFQEIGKFRLYHYQ